VQKFQTQFNPSATPQSKPIPGRAMVLNNAGGYTFEIDKWKALDRFLVLGTEGGTYYASETTQTYAVSERILKCIEEDGKRVVSRIVEVSEAGRAPKNDPALFVLALCASAKDPKTREVALAALPYVARIGTHLFHFVEYINGLRGWGRALRRAIAEWYTLKRPEDLAYQVVKYQSRDGWSHRDLLRLAHPKAVDGAQSFGATNSTLRWVAGKTEDYTLLLPLLAAFERAKFATTKELIALIREHGLTREMLPTEALTKPEVWEALLEKMPMEAMVRNLGNMGKCGLLKPFSEAATTICTRLNDVAALRKSRIHPIKLLAASTTYEGGHGVRGKGTWVAATGVVEAMERAFYNSFGNVAPIGKPVILALDVSGSMGAGTVAGVVGLTPRAAAAALALVTANVEPQYEIIGFTDGTKRLLGITPGATFKSVVDAISRLPFDRTDCAQPMLWAMREGVRAHSFVIYTDNETWCGTPHPTQALKAYRDRFVDDATLAVVAMTATSFTIADPSDPKQLDVVGFDTATPDLVAQHARGEL